LQGIAYNTTGPALLDLAELVNSKVSKVSWTLTTRGLGIGIGSLFRGHAIDVTRCRTSSTIISYFVFAGLTATIPWSNYLEAMLCVFFLQGLAIGFIEAGKSPLSTILMD
jgi:predicted MFS family arabinose efflux permease